MRVAESTKNHQIIEVAFFSVFLVIFFQLIVDFVEGIYAFGLLGTGIPVEIISIAFFLSPLLMLLFPNGIKRGGLVLIGWAMLLSRSVEVMLPTRGRMIIAGLGVACFLILFPSLIWHQSRRERKTMPINIGLSVALAVSLLILLRVVNSSLDISTDGELRWVGWGLALLFGLLLVAILREDHLSVENSIEEDSGVNIFKLTGLALGIMAAMTMIYFAFFSPNVIARWTGADYRLIVTILMLSLTGYGILVVLRPGWLIGLCKTLLWLWNLVFVASLVGLIYLHQIPFPGDLGSFPVYEPAVPWWVGSLLFFTLILFPIILLDFTLLHQELIKTKLPYGKLGGAFTIASLAILLMVLSHVFTTTYDYIPLIGPLFRDKFWVVYLIVGIVMILPLGLVRKYKEIEGDLFGLINPLVAFPGLLVVMGIISITATHLLSPLPEGTSALTRQLKILTYNIQQGYSELGLKNYDGQLELIRQIDADVIGLQESDTNRIANGNTDIVRYFADHLNLYSYFGPKTVTGTFGIALLSKYPIENPRVFYMYSEGEQTATIEAQITVNGETFNIYVTHLGNGGPMVQQQQILEVVGGKENLILIGDFNFRPYEQQYKLTTAILEDAWIVRWPGGNLGQGIDPSDRIDHTFLTPGTIVNDSEYIADPASDHPAMWSVISW